MNCFLHIYKKNCSSVWILLTRSSIINTLKHPKCRRLFLLTPFIHTVLQNWQSFLYNPLFPCDFPLEFSCQTTFWILLFVKHFVPFSELLNECNNFLSPSIAELKKKKLGCWWVKMVWLFSGCCSFRWNFFPSKLSWFFFKVRILSWYNTIIFELLLFILRCCLLNVNALLC